MPKTQRAAIAHSFRVEDNRLVDQFGKAAVAVVTGGTTYRLVQSEAEARRAGQPAIIPASICESRSHDFPASLCGTIFNHANPRVNARLTTTSALRQIVTAGGAIDIPSLHGGDRFAHVKGDKLWIKNVPATPAGPLARLARKLGF